MLEEIKNKIRELGIQEEKIQQVLDAISQEILDHLFGELADMYTDEELETYAKRMEESKSNEHLQTIVNEIALTVYGENMEEKLKDDYLLIIDELKKNMEQAKDLALRAQNGDPDAQTLLEKAKETEEYKNIMAQQPTSTDDSF